MEMYDERQDPDWVILGARVGPGGVVLVASSDLIDAELRETRPEPLELWQIPKWVQEDPAIVLSTKMRRCVMVCGATYEEALRRLFQTWTPEASHPAIGTPAGPVAPVSQL